MESDAVAIVRQAFDTHNFGQIFANHWVICKCKRESDEQAHALIVVAPMGMEVDTAFRYVHADRKVFKVFVAYLRRTDPQHLAHLGPSAKALLRLLSLAVRHHSFHDQGGRLKRQRDASNALLANAYIGYNPQTDLQKIVGHSEAVFGYESARGEVGKPDWDPLGRLAATTRHIDC